MYCVVLCKLDKTYLLRHIIYDVLTDSNISELKKKYYEEYNEIDTDEFHLYADKSEMNELFVKKHISTFFTRGCQHRSSLFFACDGKKR